MRGQPAPSRAFVIGNGSSLNETPVDALRDEFTIGMNRFDLLGLDWTPDWWVLADVRPEDGWWDWEDLLSRDSQFVFREHDRYFIEPYERDNVIYMERCEHIGGRYVPTEWHLPLPCDYGGGVSIALQKAAELGHNPVYLVGCDLYEPWDEADGDINHFDPAYCSHKDFHSDPEIWGNLNRRLVIGHEVAKWSAEAMGISILNATIGGNLEVYERVDVHEVLNGKN